MQAQQTELPEWQSRLRERLLIKHGEGSEALLAELSPEEALTTLRDILLPESQRQGKSLVVRNALGLLMLIPLMVLLFAARLRQYLPLDLTDVKTLALLIGPLVVLVTFWLVFDLKSRRLSRLWTRIYGLLPNLVLQVRHTTGLSALIDFVTWLDTFGLPIHSGTSGNASDVADAHSQLRRAAQRNMLRLLSHLSDAEARALTENNRLVLLKLAQKAEDEVDMGIAALLVLGAMQEARVRPVAQKLTGSFLPRVREAAKECLGQLKR